jgi:hypothetical protein
MFLHLATYIGSYDHVRELFRKLDLEYGSGERFEYLSFYFDLIVFWHVLKGFYKIAGESIYKREENANLFSKKQQVSVLGWFTRERQRAQNVNYEEESFICYSSKKCQFIFFGIYKTIW